MGTLRTFLFIAPAVLLAAACAAFSAPSCPVTDPVWAKPPGDPAVPGTPAFGYYFVNAVWSMLASAWWHS